ncbi:MAG: hypothetical protein WA890_18575 [Micromonospora sp.]
MNARLCAELRAIKPVTDDDICTKYTAQVKAMTDEQLAREVARVEALPGSGYRRIANDEADRRTATAWTALVDRMRPAGTWGWQR